MSFFGALAGLGQGLADEGAYQEKLGTARSLQQEKLDAELQRQRERAQDRADQITLMASLREPRAARGSGGGGLNLFELAQSAETPEQQTRLMESVRAFSGDDAANVLGRIFGKGDTQTVNPTAGDMARYDRTLDENGQSAAAVPQSYVTRAQVDSQKGQLALQRLLGLVAGKSKDQAEGEARNLGTDAVRGALETGKDADMRKAGATNMALEGRDRFGVSDGTSYDKAGVSGTSTTEVGKAKIAEDLAHAGKYSAEAKNEKDGGGKKGEKLSDLIKASDADLLNIRTQLNALKDSFTPDGKAAVQELRAREREVLANKNRYVSELEKRVLPGAEPQAAAAPKAEPMLPLPASKDKLVSGKTYNTARGPAKWNGTAFEAR